MDIKEIKPKFRSDILTAVDFLKSEGCTEIYIFGSVVNNTAREESDIDIAVKGLKPENYFSVYGELMMQLKHPVDLVDLNLQKEFGNRLLSSGEMLRVA